MKIVILEPLGLPPERVARAFEPLISKGHELRQAIAPLNGVDEQLAFAADADVLVIANRPLDPKVIAGLSQLKLLAVAFTGLDHVPEELLSERGIPVLNAQGYATEATAELTLALMLSALRRLPEQMLAAKAGQGRIGPAGQELFGKTVGLIGTGAIACRLAALLKPFSCRLLGYARHERQEAKALGMTYVSLEELLKESDLVSLHLPLHAESRGLIDAKALHLMKPSAILINTARGGVVETQALAKALNEGVLAAAYVDVLESEPPFDCDDPLLLAKNCFVTPHLGFLTEEAMERRLSIVVSNIASELDKRTKL